MVEILYSHSMTLLYINMKSLTSHENVKNVDYFVLL